MSLLIRRYQPKDKDVVLTLFSDGIREHIHPCFQNAMTSPLYIFISLTLCVVGYLLGSLFVAVLFPAAWATLIYYCSYKMFDDYVQERLRTDMQDIIGNYLSRPGDCFWVAEAEHDGKTQILGMVAVMAKQSGKEKVGELFRMIISPKCRRMGLGNKMTQTVIDFCKDQGFSKVVLETSSTQMAAVALYKKLGFKLKLTHKDTQAGPWIILLTRVTILKMEKNLCKSI
uniref:Si:ch211-81n22.1 n=1 Tax=Oryzias latipes TaxID=8090 RepID=A0A3P9MA72_ORYLA